ncbi:tRNA dihydrouridine(20/20a) synthase DusA [Aquariibacter lacus]|uniref:tRNA dihydrouridine(20/20a) synthase DusA n=1 Tax=Aquariibacter lacus TaxID=2801332 RepID=UPI00330754E5
MTTASSLIPAGPVSPWRVCVAPMLDWTDRHCRVFHRLLSRRARLYTEMVTTGALLHGDQGRHLDFDAREHPLALQLGGSEPADLAACAKLAEAWGYDEVNLNCGCPSSRVQRGAFGACLMAEPARVAEGVKAMREAVAIPVTVKHRIGLGRVEDYGFVRDFVGTVAEAGCTLFIVHARNAWLDGLSPKDNREVPPLRHDWAQRLKRDFPQLGIVVNGGLAELPDLAAQLAQLDGVMVGRAAYHQPWRLAGWDAAFFGEPAPATAASRDAVEAALVDYMAALPAGTPWTHVARHMLGLRDGQPGARRWRQIWSDHRLKAEPVRQVAALARQACHDAEAGSTVPA